MGFCKSQKMRNLGWLSVPGSWCPVLKESASNACRPGTTKKLPRCTPTIFKWFTKFPGGQKPDPVTHFFSALRVWITGDSPTRQEFEF